MVGRNCHIMPLPGWATSRMWWDVVGHFQDGGSKLATFLGCDGIVMAFPKRVQGLQSEKLFLREDQKESL